MKRTPLLDDRHSLNSVISLGDPIIIIYQRLGGTNLYPGIIPSTSLLDSEIKLHTAPMFVFTNVFPSIGQLSWTK